MVVVVIGEQAKSRTAESSPVRRFAPSAALRLARGRDLGVIEIRRKIIKKKVLDEPHPRPWVQRGFTLGTHTAPPRQAERAHVIR